MAREIKLPQMGQTMEEGTIVTCLVKIGDNVAKGDVIFEVETDKATMEMESPAEGFVKQILVDVGETVPVNTPIIILGEENEVVQGDQPAPQVASQLTAPPETAPVTAASATPAPTAAPVASSVSAPPGARIIKLPQMGQTMEEGTIVTSMIKVGDKVAKGEVIFEVETDKATLEMESPADGIVKAILVETGETVPVNAPIAVFAEDGAEVSPDFISAVKGGAAVAPSAAPAGPAPEVSTPQAAAPAPAAKGGRVFASPRAKTTASELGVDLRQVRPSSAAVRITADEVRKAAQAGAARQPAGPAPKHSLGDIVPVNRLQKIVAERMLKSKLEIPCFYLNVRVDMTEIAKLRAALNKTGDTKVSFNDFIIRAVAIGLQHYPIMTGQLHGSHIQLADRIDIGLAISTDEGLVAPLVKDAASRSVRQIAEYSKALIERARAGKLSLDDLEGGCITVSNLGGFGVDSFIPIVVPGQCSILGVGRIADTCMPIDGNIMVRKIMNLNLSVDHKVANGADAAQFLDYVKKLLENPSTFEE